jgi:hypothetical protein
MSFREQKATCPRCRMLLEIKSVLIDERATVRIIGRCANPFCAVDEAMRDVDPLQVAAAESSLKRVRTPHATLPVGDYGH